MAHVGVFALNMTPRTGGAFRLIDALMATAGCSQHRCLYLSHSPRLRDGPLPANVEWIGRPLPLVAATQALLSTAVIERVLSKRAVSRLLISGTSAVPPSTFGQVDVWLWPHAFMPAPEFGPPIVAIAHDLIHHHFPENFSRRALAVRRAAERSLDRCSAILCPSVATRDDLLAAHPQLAPRVRLFTAAPSEVIRPEEYEPQLGVIEQRFGAGPFFLSVGLDWPHKNYEILMDAASIIRSRTKAPKILLVGHRRSSRLQRSIALKRAEDIVIDVGPVSRTVLAALYSRAQALLFPSQYEGFGLPIPEAMHYGLPIIASDRSCIPDVVGNGGELLPPDDAEQWAEVIVRVLRDADYRSELADRSKAAAHHYTWRKTWSQLDPVFQGLATNGENANREW